MHQKWAVAVVLVVGVLGAGVARADDGNVHEKAAAAFVEGRKLLEGGNCDSAVPKLRESLAYESSIGARLSIVDCTEQRDPLSAWRLLKEAAVLALMNHDERLSMIEQRAAMLQTKLGMLSFKLPVVAEQPGFELRVDGELVDRYVYRYGYATSAGRHLVEAIAPLGKRFSGSVTAQIGQASLVDIALEGEGCKTALPAPAAASSPPDTTPVYDRGASRRTLGLALGSFGIASIATGVVFGLLTLDKKQTLESECGGSTGNCSAANRSLDAESESAKTMAAISTVSFAVGGAALLGGVALYLTAPPLTAPKTGVRIAPQASLGGGGLRLDGTW